MRSLLLHVAHSTDKSPCSRQRRLSQPISPPPAPPNAAETPLPVVKILLANGLGELEGAFEDVTLIIKFSRKNWVGKGAWVCGKGAWVCLHVQEIERCCGMLLTLRAQK